MRVTSQWLSVENQFEQRSIRAQAFEDDDEYRFGTLRVGRSLSMNVKFATGAALDCDLQTHWRYR